MFASHSRNQGCWDLRGPTAGQGKVLDILVLLCSSVRGGNSPRPKKDRYNKKPPSHSTALHKRFKFKHYDNK